MVTRNSDKGTIQRARYRRLKPWRNLLADWLGRKSVAENKFREEIAEPCEYTEEKEGGSPTGWTGEQ